MRFSVNGVLRTGPVDLSTRQPKIPIFDCPTRVRPFYAALPPARREAYDRTARLLLISALLGEYHRAAKAMWTCGVPVDAVARPCILGRSLENMRRWSNNAEQRWFNDIDARLCLAILDLVVLCGHGGSTSRTDFA